MKTKEKSITKIVKHFKNKLMKAHKQLDKKRFVKKAEEEYDILIQRLYKLNLTSKDLDRLHTIIIVKTGLDATRVIKDILKLKECRK